jgi:hypothetical protein
MSPSRTARSPRPARCPSRSKTPVVTCCLPPHSLCRSRSRSRSRRWQAGATPLVWPRRTTRPLRLRWSPQGPVQHPWHRGHGQIQRPQLGHIQVLYQRG